MKTLEKTQTKNAELISGLNSLLADLQVFYQNLRGLHWNVKGNMFFLLHEKFEEYYNETADVVDEVAERILMIGGVPIHTLSEYINSTSLQEVKDVTDGIEAAKIVTDQSNAILNQVKKIQIQAANQNDEGTNAMLSEFISDIEKRIWMLKTFLG